MAKAWGLIVLGDPDDLVELYKGMAALAIARTFSSANFVINGETPLWGKRFDHIAFEINIPIDIKKLLIDSRPVMIVEDSRSKERLMKRKNELSNSNINIEFLYVEPVINKELMLSLWKNGTGFYRLEVGV